MIAPESDHRLASGFGGRAADKPRGRVEAGGRENVGRDKNLMAGAVTLRVTQDEGRTGGNAA